jgi:hypothetical protein
MVMMFLDARVSVRFGVVDPEAAALVADGLPDPPACAVWRFTPEAAQPGHAPGCACCAPRLAAAEALRRLFLARAKGEVAFFRSVSVFASAAAEVALRTALQTDPMLAAWFRLEG